MDPKYKKKLKLLGVYFGSKDIIEFKSKDKMKMNSLPGIKKTNSLGEFFYAEHEFSSNYQHGAIPFEKLFGSKAIYSTPDTDNSFNLNKCVFLDTETTGLSTTGGTFAFMVGVGWFENNHFLLRQYFLIHPDQEEAMLLDLENLISNHENILIEDIKGIYFGINCDPEIEKVVLFLSAGVNDDVPIYKMELTKHPLGMAVKDYELSK